MSVSILSVEERLRVALVHLDALKHLALLVDEPVSVPRFETPNDFAKWAADMAGAAAAHVMAVRDVLPAGSMNAPAPLRKERAR